MGNINSTEDQPYQLHKGRVTGSIEVHQEIIASAAAAVLLLLKNLLRQDRQHVHWHAVRVFVTSETTSEGATTNAVIVVRVVVERKEVLVLWRAHERIRL